MNLQSSPAAVAAASNDTQHYFAPAPLVSNARVIENIVIRAVSVEQTIDDVARQLEEIAKNII